MDLRSDTEEPASFTFEQKLPLLFNIFKEDKKTFYRLLVYVPKIKHRPSPSSSSNWLF